MDHEVYQCARRQKYRGRTRSDRRCTRRFVKQGAVRGIGGRDRQAASEGPVRAPHAYVIRGITLVLLPAQYRAELWAALGTLLAFFAPRGLPLNFEVCYE